MARRGRKPKRRIKWSNYGGTFLSAISLALLVFGFISLIAIFAGFGGESAVLNSWLRQLLVDKFGLIAPLISLTAMYGGLVIIGTIRWKVLKRRAFVGLIILLIGLLGTLGSMGAGAYGELLQSKTALYISTPGAVFFYFALSVFAVILITNTGLNVFFEKVHILFDFIGEKLLNIRPPVMQTGEAENSDTDHMLESGDAVVDAEVDNETGFDFNSPGLGKNQADNDFEIISPPTAPVEDEEGFVDHDDNNVADNFVGTKISVGSGESGSRNRLPFTNKVWEYPSTDLLNDAPNQSANAGNVQERAKIIESTLDAFGIKAKIADLHVGPAVTQYAISLSAGTKASRIQNLATDLALSLKSPSGSVRVVAPIPGTNLVGIELPNFTPSTVSLKSILESDELKRAKSKLAIGVGHAVNGKTLIQDIGRWPHALVAGATGSGKSVMLNAIISTLLFRCSPAECRFIMIDPKLVELSQFNGIPHLLTPVVTDIEQKAVSAFAWAVSEMDRRYQLFANAGVRDLDSYNALSGFQAEPYIVIVVDEIADMMMVAANEVEKYIIRLAQKSRATGIHLILATQRPSVNILTGTIKANVPTRIAFKVTSNTDSRVIIDQAGAETLIGRGDMLFVPPDDSKPHRVQGAFVTDDEIKRLVDYLKNTGIEPDYKEAIVQQKVDAGGTTSVGGIELPGDLDDKTAEALEIILNDDKASASYLQRKLGVGYSRAARMIDEFEEVGIVGRQQGSKAREVLVANMDEAVSRLAAGSGQHIEEE